MPMTDVWRNNVADALIGGTAFSKLDATNAHIGVGNSAAAFVSTQTDLQGASKLRKLVGTAPTRLNNVMTFIATFGTGDANFDWQEWGVFNHLTAGQMMTRELDPLGVKTSAMIREITVEITVVHA